jgi:Uma2 family endonuclease
VQWQENWELIQGYPFTMLPSATIKHQALSSNIFVSLKLLLKEKNNCNCMVLYETDWKVSMDTVVRPDIMIICDIDAQADYPTKTPRLVVEVLSTSTRNKDRNEKFQLYQQQGVPYYLIADPDTETLEIFELVDNIYRSNNSIAMFALTPVCSIENKISLH